MKSLSARQYKRRSITRETASLGRYRGMRPIVVSLDVVEGVLGFRLKGMRTTHHTSVEQAYYDAAARSAKRLIEDRKQKRKARS